MGTDFTMAAGARATRAATTLLRFVAEGQADNVWPPAPQLTHGDSVAPPPFTPTSD